MFQTKPKNFFSVIPVNLAELFSIVLFCLTTIHCSGSEPLSPSLSPQYWPLLGKFLCNSQASSLLIFHFRKPSLDFWSGFGAPPLCYHCTLHFSYDEHYCSYSNSNLAFLHLPPECNSHNGKDHITFLTLLLSTCGTCRHVGGI